MDFAVNATPCGPQPRDTALLERAQGHGMRVHQGQHTLDCQIPMDLDFFGIPYADEQTVREIAAAA